MKSPQPNSSHPTYRPDIDGLRAIAVLSVVAFHGFPRVFQGGFVGVDIFFVISGYLISTIIFENLEKGRFSLSEFYARRIKRIFPALLLVLFFCLVYGWFALLADEYKQLGKHILAGAGFVSNFALWRESGYFDNVADTKPLLHLWSLGIEEQFYIFWPLLIWLVWKSKFGLLLLTVSVLFISFVLNVYGAYHAQVATFYSPLTRLWELSAGSLLAYLILHKYVNPSEFPVSRSNAIAFTGVSLLAAAVFLTRESYAIPGWWAVLPVLGSVCLISAGTKAWLNNRILSNKLAVWFGLISFPLYLWHWPLLSFGRVAEGLEPGRSFRALAVVVAIVLAWLTFRFVERYVRNSRGYKFVGVLVMMSVILACASGYVYVNNGVPGRRAVTNSSFNADVRRQLMGPLWAYTKNDLCLSEYRYKDADRVAWWFCIKSDNRPPTLILLGNSYANQLYPGFARNPLLMHQTVLSIGTCDFAAVYSAVRPDHPCYGHRTEEQAAFIDSLIASNKSIKFAIIDGLSMDPDADYIERLRKRVSFLEASGIKVVIFTPHLRPGFNPKICFTVPMRSVAKDCSLPSTERTTLFEKFRPLLESISRSNPNVRFFENNDIFCSGERCSFVLNGIPLSRDEGHISEYASIQLQKYFTEWARVNIPAIFDASVVNRSE
jgi:peptidoglycan/LPS O-acetylase OafA/YrhL